MGTARSKNTIAILIFTKISIRPETRDLPFGWVSNIAYVTGRFNNFLDTTTPAGQRPRVSIKDGP